MLAEHRGQVTDGAGFMVTQPRYAPRLRDGKTGRQATSGKLVASLKRGSSAVSPSENFASKVPYAPPEANNDSTKCLVEKGRSIAGPCVSPVQEYWLAGGGSWLGEGFGEVCEMLLHLLQPLQGPLEFCPAQGHGGGERAECLG